MKFFERKERSEREPYEPDELENLALQIASSWRAEGTPWWNGFVMGRELQKRTDKLIGPGTYLSKFHKLEREGYLESVWGGRPEGLETPLSEIPPLPAEPISNPPNFTRYYTITDMGQQMRGFVTGLSFSATAPSGALPENS